MKTWTCGSSPRCGSRNVWTRIKNIKGDSRLSKFWNFFGALHMISCRDWWPWKKPVYITMTRRQSNNQWRGGIGVHPTPKNSECKNLLEISRLDFLGSRQHPLIDYLPKGQTINAEYYSSLLAQLKDILKENRRPREGHQRCLVLERQCPGTPGTCNPEETGLSGFPVSWSPILFSGSGPVGLPSVPWTEKNNWNVTIFLPTRRSLMARRPSWMDKFLIFFFSGLQKLE